MRDLEPNAWIFSDPHYNHRFLVNKGCRPEGYESLIQESWVSQVESDHTIYCLGDVCMKDDAKVHETFIRTLPGKKILIRGNHDRQKDIWYLDNGWDEVYDSLKVSATVNNRHMRVLLTHIPVPMEKHFDLNVHGHLHNDNHRAGKPEMQKIHSNKHFLVAMEALDYQIVPFLGFLEGKFPHSWPVST